MTEPLSSRDRARVALGARTVLTELVQVQDRQRIVVAHQDQGQVLVEGRFLAERYASGLRVMVGASEEMAEASIVSAIQPCLCLTILLEGRLDFSYDHHQYRLADGQALVVNLRRQAAFRRRTGLQPGPLRKVHLALNADWFRCSREASPLLGKLDRLVRQEHLCARTWHPAAGTLARCEAMLDLLEQADPLLRRLRLESLANGVICDLLESLAGLEDGEGGAAAEWAVDPLARALSFVEARLHTDISLLEVAEAAAVSVSVLQRHFKRQWGLTVFDYVRQRRLEKARDALQREGISIGEAAYLAGYNHTSNFVTAFKRRFGVTPGERGD